MLLEATDLRFGYDRTWARSRPGASGLRPGAAVVDGVSIGIRAGSFAALLGPNGAGKTTLLRLLTGALAPSSGHVRLEGHDIRTIPRRILATRLAVVPQDTHLAFDYTAIEIVLMGRYPRLGAFEVEGPDDLAAANRALDATGTLHLASRPFPHLSGGEQQRVIIAAALAQLDDGEKVQRSKGPRVQGLEGPRVPDSLLFMDEPTASLDLRHQIELAALLRRLNVERGLTILLSTHDLKFASTLCNETILLSEGRVLAHGPTGDVMTPDLIGALYRIPADVAAPILS